MTTIERAEKMREKAVEPIEAMLTARMRVLGGQLRAMGFPLERIDYPHGGLTLYGGNVRFQSPDESDDFTEDRIDELFQWLFRVEHMKVCDTPCAKGKPLTEKQTEKLYTILKEMEDISNYIDAARLRDEAIDF